MHRLVGNFGAEVRARRIQEVVIQMPVQRWPGIVEHPVDDARRGLGCIHMSIECLELRSHSVVVVELRLGDVVLEAPGWAIALGQRDVERRDGREDGPGGGGVILADVWVFPERLQLLRREHTGQVLQRRDTGPRANLRIESEGPTQLVGIPIRRRNPRVGSLHLHARRSGLGGALVNCRRDNGQRPIFGMQGVDVCLGDRGRWRVVAADQKSDDRRVVPQQTCLACHGSRGHLLVRSVPRLAARLRPRFPFVAALPAREDQDAVAVGEVVKELVFELALAANRVQSQVHDITELVLHAFRIVAEEHVRRPARAANQDWLAVDDKLLIALLSEVRADVTDAESCAGLVGDRAINGSSHLQTVERMRTHADGPPNMGVFEVEGRIGLRGK